MDAGGQMIGHAGFHLPPEPLAVALDDPTFVGALEPASGGAVEMGYTVFPSSRGEGYATEAVRVFGQLGGHHRRGGGGAGDRRRRERRIGPRARARRWLRAHRRGRSDDGESEAVFRRDL